MQNKVMNLIFGNSNSLTNATDTVKSPHPIAEITRQGGGFEVAGFCLNGSYRILSRKTGQIVDLGPKQLDEATLLAHIGMSYCLKNYGGQDPKTGKRIFLAEALAREIRQECDEFGPANPETVRGPGFYLEGRELVVNYGNAVYDQHGCAVATAPNNSRVYVAGPGLGFDRETPCATAADVHLLETTFESFGFERAWGAAASMGWLASSVMGAVLPNSPSIILTAAKGAGKSTWVTLQAALMGPQAILRDGVPTVAQVLHAVRETSVTLICDEFEPLKRSKAQMDNLAEVFNSGYTKAPGKGKFTRANGGVLRYFNPPAGVAMCGINLPALDDALESRSVRLKMVPVNRGGQAKSPLLHTMDGNTAHELGARLRRLLVQRWEVIRDTRVAVHQMLQAVGHTDRFADTYSPLLAGYIALKYATKPERHVLEAVLEQWGLSEVKVDEQESPSDACLNALLDRKIVLHLLQGDRTVKSHARVRDAIRMLVPLQANREARRPIELQLETLGLRPMVDAETGAWTLAVASSQHNVGVRQMFQGTAWSRGGWQDALLRLPGSAKGQARLAGDSLKVVVVNLPESVAHPLDGEGEELADISSQAGETRQSRGERLN